MLRPGALGDTLLAVPALRALRRAYGSLRLAAHAGAARLLATMGEVDTGLAFDDPSLTWIFEGPPTQERVVAWMAQRPGGLPTDALMAASRPPGMDRHCARYLLETLAPLGIDLSWDARPLEIEPVQSEEILVHPGSGSSTKNWPAERFAAVIGCLKRPVRLVVGEADDVAAAQVEAAVGGHLHRLETSSLVDLARRLAGCRAYLGNDSGVSHLAALSRARTVAMFGPTDPRVWAPIGPYVTVLPFDSNPSEVAAQLDAS